MEPHLVLGLDRCATLEEVKRAFRALALENHPDRGGDAREFVRIRDAYEQLLIRFQQAEVEPAQPEPAPNWAEEDRRPVSEVDLRTIMETIERELEELLSRRRAQQDKASKSAPIVPPSAILTVACAAAAAFIPTLSLGIFELWHAGFLFALYLLALALIGTMAALVISGDADESVAYYRYTVVCLTLVAVLFGPPQLGIGKDSLLAGKPRLGAYLVERMSKTMGDGENHRRPPGNRGLDFE